MAHPSRNLKVNVSTVLFRLVLTFLVGFSPTFLIRHLCENLVRNLGTFLVWNLSTFLPGNLSKQDSWGTWRHVSRGLSQHFSCGTCLHCSLSTSLHSCLWKFLRCCLLTAQHSCFGTFLHFLDGIVQHFCTSWHFSKGTLAEWLSGSCQHSWYLPALLVVAPLVLLQTNQTKKTQETKFLILKKSKFTKSKGSKKWESYGEKDRIRSKTSQTCNWTDPMLVFLGFWWGEATGINSFILSDTILVSISRGISFIPSWRPGVGRGLFPRFPFFLPFSSSSQTVLYTVLYFCSQICAPCGWVLVYL